MKHLLQRYLRIVTERPWVVIGAVALVTLGFGIKLGSLQVDSTPYFIDGEHPKRLEEAVVRERFTSSKEQAYVLVVTAGEDVFNRATLANVASLTEAFETLTLADASDIERLEALDADPESARLVRETVADGTIDRGDVARLEALGARLAGSGADAASLATLDEVVLRAHPVHRVRSLTTIENMVATDGMLEIGPLIDPARPLAPALGTLREAAADNPLYRDFLLADDLRATTVHVEFNVPDHDSRNLVAAHEAMRRVVDGIDSADAIHIGGTPVVNAQIVQVLEQDNALFFPLVVLVIAAVLYACFRRAQGVLAPLAVAILSVVWTMGWMALVGIEQNIVTTALPVFLITIGVTDAIHYLSACYARRSSVDRREAALDSLATLFRPLLLTTVTTMTGFFALSLTDLEFVHQFGQVMVVGVLFAFVLTVTLLPCLVIVGGRGRHVREDGERATRLHTVAPAAPGATIARLALALHRRLAAAPRRSLVVLLIVLAGVGLLNTQLVFDQRNIASFSADSRLRVDDAVLNEHLGGTSPLNISFHAEQPGAFKEPEAIRALDRIASRLLEHYPTIGYVTSPADYVKRIHQVLDGAAPFALPAGLSRPMLAQYYLLYESSNGQEIHNVLDETYSNARIAMLGHTDRASAWRELVGEMDEYIAQTLPAGITHAFSGVGYIQTANLEEVIASQVRSLLIAAVLVLGVISLLFRSLLVGLIGIVPLVLTLATLFAVMALAGVHLDIGTSLIAGLVFGIGVDYSIHLITHFRRHRLEQGLPFEESLRATLDTVARPIAVNSLALAGGFLVLAFSSYAPLAYLGLFVSGTMLVCAMLVLVIVPLLLRLCERWHVERTVGDGLASGPDNRAPEPIDARPGR